MRKLVLLGGTAAAAAAAWKVFVRIQGDAELVFDGGLSGMSAGEGSVHGEVTIMNRGRQPAILRKVEGRLVDGPPGRVLVTRKESRPHRRGWWVSNVLEPGQSCVAEVDVEVDTPGSDPIVIELDAHEIGRGLITHRTLRFEIPAPAPAA